MFSYLKIVLTYGPHFTLELVVLFYVTYFDI